MRGPAFSRLPVHVPDNGEAREVLSDYGSEEPLDVVHCALRRRWVLAGARGWAFLGLVAILGTAACAAAATRARADHLSRLNLAARAYQQVNSYGRVIEQRTAGVAAADGLRLAVEDLVLQTAEGEVRARLARVGNPRGRLSLHLPDGACRVGGSASRPQRRQSACRLAVDVGVLDMHGGCAGNVVVDSEVVQAVPLSQSEVNFGVRGPNMVLGYFTPGELPTFEMLLSGASWLVRNGETYVSGPGKDANASAAGDSADRAGPRALGWSLAGELLILELEHSALRKDGRRPTLYELADFLVKRGAADAISLRGEGGPAMERDGASAGADAALLCVHEHGPAAHVQV